MRMVCPDCAAGYEVPDALLAGRKSVRCVRCGGSWSAAVAVPEPALPVLVAEPREAAPTTTARDWHLPAAWVASIAIVALALAALLVEHRPVAAAWPPIQRLYGAIGLR